MTKVKILKHALFFSTPLIKNQDLMTIYLTKRSPLLPLSYKGSKYKTPQAKPEGAYLWAKPRTNVLTNANLGVWVLGFGAEPNRRTIKAPYKSSICKSFAHHKSWWQSLYKASLCKPLRAKICNACTWSEAHHKYKSKICKKICMQSFVSPFGQIFEITKICTCRKRGTYTQEERYLYIKQTLTKRFESTNVQPFAVLACNDNPNKSSSSKNILQIINGIKNEIIDKQLIEYSTNIVCALSGGQDSIFLAFFLSFLQLQKPFNVRFIWCNHFWQTCSFYTTFHLTRCVLSFSSPIIGFLPFQTNASPLFYKSVLVDYKKKEDSSSFVSTKRHLKNRREIFLSTPDRTYARVKRCFDLFVKDDQQILLWTKSNTTALGRSPTTRVLQVSLKNRERSFYARRFLHLSATKKTDRYRKQHRHRGYKKFIERRSEAQARTWRHITIERGSTFYGSTLCMYGHTGSDRVETILFNLIRGSGKRALACLPWKQRYSHFCYNKFYPSYKQVIKSTHLRDCHFLKE